MTKQVFTFILSIGILLCFAASGCSSGSSVSDSSVSDSSVSEKAVSEKAVSNSGGGRLTHAVGALPPAVQLDKETFDDYASKSYYQYIKKETVMERIFKWLFRNFQFRGFGRGELLQNILIGLGIVAVAVVLFLILRNLRIASRNKRLAGQSKDLSVIETDDDEFERRIRAALEAGRFAEATRWLFLKTLKYLHVHSLISFDANKTVYEYAYELAGLPVQRPFNDLARRFAYYHYGQAEVDEPKYRQFSRINDELLNSIANDEKK